MKKTAILPAWGRVLRGYRPFLSVEITKECPLHCPGCYTYAPDHLNNGLTTRQLRDHRGKELVEGVLELVRRFRPLHVSLVGGEPLVRLRELEELIPKLDAMGIEVQLVTSAVIPIPRHWARLPNLHLVVSVDGLQPEHDARRSPATYAKILEHMAGHRLIIHCTITRQLLSREDYLQEFASYWSRRQEARKIWFSLYTPQKGERSEERLSARDRLVAIERLARLRPRFPKVHLPESVLGGYRHPPSSPAECMFARLTTCVAADLATLITPCQLGGKPVCAECGCLAAAGLALIGKFKLAGLVSGADIFTLSEKFAALFHHN